MSLFALYMKNVTIENNKDTVTATRLTFGTKQIYKKQIGVVP